MTNERTAPVQGGPPIPWWLHEEAWGEYSKRYGKRQSADRIAERGGFGTLELDDLIPGWRDRRLLLDRIRAEVERATCDRIAEALGSGYHSTTDDLIGWLMEGQAAVEAMTEREAAARAEARAEGYEQATKDAYNSAVYREGRERARAEARAEWEAELRRRSNGAQRCPLRRHECSVADDARIALARAEGYADGFKAGRNELVPGPGETRSFRMSMQHRRMKTVYIAGPIGASTVGEMMANCGRACRLAHRLSKAGLAVVCVHAMAAFEIQLTGSDAAGERHRQVMAQDFELLERCDAVVLVTEDYEVSKGTTAEVEHAYAKGIPVFAECEALRWSKEGS